MKPFACLAGLVLAAGMASAADMPGGLVLRFSCDELRNNGTLLPDASGSNNHGRVTGGVRPATGRLNGCCEFIARGGGFVQVPSSPSLENEHMTVCFWLRLGKIEAPDRTLVERQTEDAGYALQLVTGGEDNRKGLLQATVGAGKHFVSDEPITDNDWHHIALSYDGKTAKLYVDSVLQTQLMTLRGGDLSVNAKDADLLFGMSGAQVAARSREGAFEGMLDEILVFNRALTSTEVKDALTVSKPQFTKWQVERRLKELKELRDRNLITQEFYERKVKECEVD